MSYSAIANERNRRALRGFTLIEIMATVLIMGLLMGIVGYQVFQQVDKGRVTATRAQISSLESVLELYRMDNARFPTTEQGLQALVEPSSLAPEPRNFPPGGYLKGGRVPLDPWGEPYHYESPGSNNTYAFDLWSFGADGAAGGEGPNGDVMNWANEGGNS